LWHHQHTFVADPAGTRMLDNVSYKLPFGPIGRLAHRLIVRRDLERIFDFRAWVIRDEFASPAGVRR
jgi:ligand-binding SRPBCC domain-containing protein